MDCAVKFVSRNLANLSNFVKFQDSRNILRNSRRRYSVKLENEILEKSRRMYIFKEYSIMINEIETGTK